MGLTLMRRVIALIISLIFLSAAILNAQEVPTFDKKGFIASSETRTTLELRMVDCVSMALKNNSEILVKKITPLIADDNILIRKAKFEPALSFDWTMSDDTDLSDSPLFGPNPRKTRLGVFNFGYDQKLVTGTDIALDFYNTRTRSNANPLYQSSNPNFDSLAEASVTQPLLKGFGIIVNKADYLIAKNNKLISQQDFIGEVIKVLTNIKKNYYEFQYTQEQYRVAETSLERVQDLLDINREKYSKGLASDVDVVESESEVARVEQALFASEAMLKLAEDNLKLTTNLVDNVELWNAKLVLLDDLTYEKKEPGLTQAILKAFDYRPDYKAARIDLENKGLSVIFYRNGMLPTLDLKGTYGFNGLGKTYEKDLGHIGGGKYQDWSIGVTARLPLGSEKEKGEYERSKHEKEQALIKFNRLEQRIILEVRDAVRNIDINYRKLESSAKSKEAETRNYHAQEQRFRAGLVSTLDIVTYQERLARAEVTYVRSVIDYCLSLLELARVQGTMLADENIKIE